MFTTPVHASKQRRVLKHFYSVSFLQPLT